MFQGLQFAFLDQSQNRAISALLQADFIRKGFDADSAAEVASDGAHSVFRVWIAVMYCGIQVCVMQSDTVDIGFGKQTDLRRLLQQPALP